MKSSDIKAQLLNALAIEADTKLAKIAFTRKPRSTEFTRQLSNAVQVFDVTLAVHPSYARDAMAHVYPRVRLFMPEVCKKASELVEGNPVLLANAPEIMVNRPLEHLVPKAERIQWYAFHEADFHTIVSDVVGAFLKWGAPFFDQYRTAADVVTGFESGDERPKLHENWSIFVAAAMLVEGNGKRAADLIESAFNSPGARKKYAVVFSNLDRMLN